MISTVKLAIAAGVVLALAADAASAAPARVKTSTNLRQGPGTTYGVTATVPAGSVVEITNCAAEWCTAHWRGRTGYMIASNLDLAGPGPGGPGPVVAGGPPVVVYADPGPVVYGPPYYYGPRYYWGSRYRYWRRW
jgi:uncharacterized protein YraI